MSTETEEELYAERAALQPSHDGSFSAPLHRLPGKLVPTGRRFAVRVVGQPIPPDVDADKILQAERHPDLLVCLQLRQIDKDVRRCRCC